jgi:hypothetical protein
VANITVTRFEVDFRSGTPTMARIIAYEDADDRNGYSIAALGKSDPQNKLLAPAIVALATAWPNVPANVQIQVNASKEIVAFVFPQT